MICRVDAALDSTAPSSCILRNHCLDLIDIMFGFIISGYFVSTQRMYVMFALKFVIIDSFPYLQRRVDAMHLFNSRFKIKFPGRRVDAMELIIQFAIQIQNSWPSRRRDICI